MDPNYLQHNTSMNTDPMRPPQFCTCNIGCGCGQVFGENDGGSDSDARRQRTITMLQNIVREQQSMCEDVSDNGSSVSNGDEGLEDHQLEQHIDAADLGSFHTGEVKRLIAHHHSCECPICPFRIKASIYEWLNEAVDPETPGSMYPEHGSGELSMASSMFLDTRPQTPGQLLVETGGWLMDIAPRFHEEYEYITSPLWLVPERTVPHQLETCIPEESEPDSDNESF